MEGIGRGGLRFTEGGGKNQENDEEMKTAINNEKERGMLSLEETRDGVSRYWREITGERYKSENLSTIASNPKRGAKA